MTAAPLLTHPELDQDVADWLVPRVVLIVLDSLATERPELPQIAEMPPEKAESVRAYAAEWRRRCAALRDRLQAGERMSLGSIAAEAGVPVQWLAGLVAEMVRQVTPTLRAAEAKTKGTRH